MKKKIANRQKKTIPKDISIVWVNVVERFF